MENPTQEMLAKLPKWAQEHMQRLSSERELAVRALNTHLESQKPSRVYWDTYLCTGEERDKGKSGPTSKRFYVQSNRLIFESEGVNLEVICTSKTNMHDPGIRLQWSAIDNTSEHVALVPYSFQSAYLISATNLRTAYGQRQTHCEHLYEKAPFCVKCGLRGTQL
jgi:hypothetical protein